MLTDPSKDRDPLPFSFLSLSPYLKSYSFMIMSLNGNSIAEVKLTSLRSKFAIKKEEGGLR